MDVREKLVELLLREDGLCKPDECKDCNANGSCYYYRAADINCGKCTQNAEWTFQRIGVMAGIKRTVKNAIAATLKNIGLALLGG